MGGGRKRGVGWGRGRHNEGNMCRRFAVLGRFLSALEGA